MPDRHPDHPVSIYKMDNGVTMIITVADIALLFDSAWTRPDRGYQQVMEFLVDDDAAVDTVWDKRTSAGYSGRTAPAHLNGPYATMVEDPDGNVVLITTESTTNADAPAPV